MLLNVYTLPIPSDMHDKTPIEYASDFCTTSNFMSIDGSSVTIKLIDNGTVNHQDAVFVGTEEIN